MNPYRGDFEIELGGKTWLLRPDFEALCEIEECIQGPYSTIMNDARESNMPRIKHMAAVVWACIRGGLRKEQNGSIKGAPQFSEVGQMIQSQGIATVAEPIIKLITYMLLTDDQIKDAENEEAGQEEVPSSGVESPSE